MKKLTALSLSIAAYLIAAMPARAQFGGNICPQNTEGAGEDGANVMNFNPLCRLYADSGSLVANLINIALVVTVIIALAFLIYGGIKWITSGGDKAGVESARNMIVAALVGLVIAFLAYFILQIVFELFGVDFAGGNFWASLTLFNNNPNPAP